MLSVGGGRIALNSFLMKISLLKELMKLTNLVHWVGCRHIIIQWHIVMSLLWWYVDIYLLPQVVTKI